MVEHYEAVIIGGGAAGLSAALVLGRARRSTALIDAGAPSNSPADGVGGLLGHDRRPPGELYEIARRELAHYPAVRHLSGTAAALHRTGANDWSIGLQDQSTSRSARHVLLATGMRYAYPPLPGIEQLWGHSVFHCPFCHGWEHRDQPLAVLGGGPATLDRTLLLRGWTDTITLITPPGSLTDDARRTLTAAGVKILDATVTALHGENGQLHTVELDNGDRHHARGLLVTAGHQQRSPLAEDAGVALDPTGHIVIDDLGRTNQTGIWAAGDLTSPVSSVARAVAAGSLAATWITHALVAEQHGLAFPPPGAPGGAPYHPTATPRS